MNFIRTINFHNYHCTIVDPETLDIHEKCLESLYILSRNKLQKRIYREIGNYNLVKFTDIIVKRKYSCELKDFLDIAVEVKDSKNCEGGEKNETHYIK